MAAAWLRVMPEARTAARSLCLLIAASARQHCPEICLIEILGNAASTPVEESQLGLGREAAMFGGPAEPAESLLLVADDSVLFVPLKITKPQSILGDGIAVLRHLPHQFEGPVSIAGSRRRLRWVGLRRLRRSQHCLHGLRPRCLSLLWIKGARL